MRILRISSCLALALVAAAAGGQPAVTARRVAWTDLPATVQGRLTRSGITADRFAGWLETTATRTRARVAEGDADHLVFYALQSTRFTSLPPIEPAASALDWLQALSPEDRERQLTGAPPAGAIPFDVQGRLRALVRALSQPSPDARLGYFQRLLDGDVPGGGNAREARERYLETAYRRAMRFLAQQALAGRTTAASMATLYQTRGLSTDTGVEAGYLVSLGIGSYHALAPGHRIRRVAIVGPGLDLAPRSGLVEDDAPRSYQAYAVVDALLSTGAANPGALTVTIADVNPRVVEYFRLAHAPAPSLRLTTGLAESDALRFSDDYRDYFTALGRGLGEVRKEAPLVDRYGRRLRQRLAIDPRRAPPIDAHRLDIVTERADIAADLIVVTNVLAYFDDTSLALALVNLEAMLAPGGVLLHNEARPAVAVLTAELNMPLLHSRRAVLATVRGGPPIHDSTFLHREQGTRNREQVR